MDAVTTADIKGPAYMDADSIFLPEVSEDHEVLGAGARDEVYTQETSEYDTKMDLDVANIDKSEKKACMTIYKVIDDSYFSQVKLFPISITNFCKNHPNEPQNIPTDINNN